MQIDKYKVINCYYSVKYPSFLCLLFKLCYKTEVLHFREISFEIKCPTLSSCLCSNQTLLKSGEQCWSLAELVQAVVILAHCHSLCSFVFGSNTDSDFAPLTKSPNGTPPNFCPFDAANGNTNVPQSPAAPSEHITRRRVTAYSCEVSYTILFLQVQSKCTL